LVKGGAQAAAQLMDQRLSDQRQGHLSQANVQVEGAGPFPTQVLVKAEELLDVPAVGEIRVGTSGRGRVQAKPLKW